MTSNLTQRFYQVIGLTLSGVLLAFTAWTSLAEARGIADTKHNLTPSGPGNFKATENTGLCVFCHTPHNASPQGALWNRELSAATYTLYTSTTLKSLPSQPSGSSRLCLSCHDGTMAMGTVLRPLGGTQMTLGKLTGAGVVGTDLSDDHPISFAYDAELAATRGDLVNPTGSAKTMHLAANGQMQCTSCHDAHVERVNFLHMDPIKGALCTTCHQPSGWTSSTHASSTATWNGTGTVPWQAKEGYSTVTDNACGNCHRSHAAGHGKSLLAQTGERANCTICHAGTVAKSNFNLNNEFAKLSHHPIETNEWTHTPNEDATTMSRHVACADCHNPHASNASTATIPNVSGRLKGVRGIDQSGAPVAAATYEQEVCYKCHGLSTPLTVGIQRQDNIRNARLQFSPTNASFHPIAAVGRNTTIPATSFTAGYTASSRISCSSCHNNNDWTSGGTKPAGPHGSIYKPLLEREYKTDLTVVESPQNFALCYKCHDRNKLLTTGKFPHSKHLQDNISCAACHDPHGSRTQPNLINFMLFDNSANRNAVVTASGTRPINFTKTTTGGNCTLMCHGQNHRAERYP